MAKKRGPSYPGLSLPEAIERIRPVVKAEPHNVMTAEAAAKHLGYKGISGASLTMIADMRRYGLLEGRGDEIKVSRDALTIIADEHAVDQSERAQALKRCATNDSVFSSIFAHNKGIPAEATLTSYLMKNGYNTVSAQQAASNYISTMKFVNDLTKDYNTPNEGKPLGENLPFSGTKPNMKEIQLPYSNDAWAIISAPFPLDESSWNQMLAVLNAMKPGLVSMNKLSKKEELGDDKVS